MGTLDTVQGRVVLVWRGEGESLGTVSPRCPDGGGAAFGVPAVERVEAAPSGIRCGVVESCVCECLFEQRLPQRLGTCPGACLPFALHVGMIHTVVAIRTDFHFHFFFNFGGRGGRRWATECASESVSASF